MSLSNQNLIGEEIIKEFYTGSLFFNQAIEIP
jgi:hypothetical protein